MKKFISLALLASLIVSLLCSCSNQNSSKTAHSPQSLAEKAEAILDELPNQAAVSDFREIYDILSNLSSSKSKFLKQLDAARSIAKKYDVSLKGTDLFFGPATPIDMEGAIEKYKEDKVFYDVSTALQVMIDPFVFQLYGHDVQCVPNVSRTDLAAAISASNYYCKETDSRYDISKLKDDVWSDRNALAGNYKISYYENDLIYNLEIPVMKVTLSQADANTLFYSKDSKVMEQLAKKYVDAMLMSFNGFSAQNAVLSLLFSDADLLILENFIKSLNSEYIWENNAAGDEINHTNPILQLSFNHSTIFISFSYSSISLSIFGNNLVNAYSSRYYTLRCYFAGLNEDEYASYINMDTSANVDSSADTINLDAMREDYSTSTLPSEDNDSGNEIVVPEDTTIPEPAVQPDFTNPENSVPTSSPSQNEQTTTPTLDEYYAQATAAYSTFIQSLSTYGDLSAGYQDAKQKILRCEGYQDSTAMLKVVECLYTAHVKMGPTSGWNADLDSMAVHATGTNISITKEDFIGNGSSLRLSSDVSKKTFTATLSHVFAANMRNHGEIKVIEALILLFSNIEDTAALTAKLENENNWALNGENETISFTYSDYSVAIQVSPEAQGYINCVISVAKQ